MIDTTDLKSVLMEIGNTIKMLLIPSFFGEDRFVAFPFTPLDSPDFPIRVPAVFATVLQGLQ